MSDTKSECYIGGEEPARGDIIGYPENSAGNKDFVVGAEAQHLWITTSICGDMLRAKCQVHPHGGRLFT